jgi:hypothetical protein
VRRRGRLPTGTPSRTRPSHRTIAVSDRSTASGENPYVDTANRLERQIETQIDTIEGIDNKAEHVTRLVGILIGLVFSVLSLAVNYDGVELARPTPGAEIAFLLGIIALLTAMGAAMVTYLTSRYRAGLHYNVGYYVSNKDESVDFDVHIKRVCGSYGHVIEQNKNVIEANSKRFRRALYLLLVGVLFLATTGLIHLGEFTVQESWYGLLIGVFLTIATGWYLFTGRYLTLDPIG